MSAGMIKQIVVSNSGATRTSWRKPDSPGGRLGMSESPGEPKTSGRVNANGLA